MFALFPELFDLLGELFLFLELLFKLLGLLVVFLLFGALIVCVVEVDEMLLLFVDVKGLFVFWGWVLSEVYVGLAELF